MIVGTGIDIAEVDRIAACIERFGRRFLERVFTADEIRYCESKANKAERYAGRFAAKEAGMKAIGTGWSRGVPGRMLRCSEFPAARPPSSSTAKQQSSSASSEPRAPTCPSRTRKNRPWRR